MLLEWRGSLKIKILSRLRDSKNDIGMLSSQRMRIGHANSCGFCEKAETVHVGNTKAFGGSKFCSLKEIPSLLELPRYPHPKGTCTQYWERIVSSQKGQNSSLQCMDADPIQ